MAGRVIQWKTLKPSVARATKRAHGIVPIRRESLHPLFLSRKPAVRNRNDRKGNTVGMKMLRVTAADGE